MAAGAPVSGVHRTAGPEGWWRALRPGPAAGAATRGSAAGGSAAGGRIVADMALVGGLVLAAALAGIYTRRVGLTAAFWPANPLLVGLFIRVPRLARPHGWIAAFLAFMAADLVTGGPFDRTLALTVGNLAAVAGAWLVLVRMPRRDLRLERAASIIKVSAACAAGAVAAALGGLYIGPAFFDMSATGGAGSWFASELACDMALLPVILTAPVFRRGTDGAVRALAASARRVAAPFGLLVVLLAAGVAIGGPAAIAAAVPALLWCALAVGVFETTLLTFLASAWTMVAVAHGGIDLLGGASLTDHQILSVQIALSFMAMGPIAAASHAADQERAVRRLRRVADRDALTGALTRRAFDVGCERMLADLADARRAVAVLLVDVDDFKGVNDAHGHAAGDAVLRRLGAVAAACVRDSDLFGRVGGDEFCILLPGASVESALMVAERLRGEFSAEPAGVGGETVTVSVGVVRVPVAPAAGADLLAAADRALYRAKAAGRDRIVVAGDVDVAQPRE